MSGGAHGGDERTRTQQRHQQHQQVELIFYFTQRHMAHGQGVCFSEVVLELVCVLCHGEAIVDQRTLVAF